MKRVVAVMVLMALAAVACVALAQFPDSGKFRARDNVRILNAGNPAVLDTLGGDGAQVTLIGFQMYGKDSSGGCTVNVDFWDSDYTRYYRVTETYTTGQTKITNWGNDPVAFPCNKKIFACAYVSGTSTESMDTLKYLISYRVTRCQ